MTTLLEEIIAKIGAMPPANIAKLERILDPATKAQRWVPNPGPQTEAYKSKADVLLFGGSAGGGKSELLLGLAFTQHKRSLIMRRQYTDLGAIIERAIAINGTKEGFNGSPPPKLRTTDKRLVEFGAAAKLGDEEHRQGQAHSLLGFDEVAQFHEKQVRFLMGWVRSTDPDERCRVVMTSNPPMSVEGQWIVSMFRPWLDETHPRPAKPGELRWYVTDHDGKDKEVDGPEPVVMEDGKINRPLSRTFIPGRLSDNPDLARTDYQAKLDALPEPIRSAVRDGNFMAAREDHERQAIPTEWVRGAQARWTPKPPPGVPMCAIGVDVAAGGNDETVLAIRHDAWFAPLIAVPGRQTPTGSSIAGMVMAKRRDQALVILDMGGGFGGGAFEHLKDNGVEVMPYKGAEGSVGRTADRQLGFYNRRSEAWWRLREALDPGQIGGSPVALPEDAALVADLTAPTFEVGPRGVQVETKEEVVKRLGRSTDRGDAVVMAWFRGTKGLNIQGGFPAAHRGSAAEQGLGRKPRVEVITSRMTHGRGRMRRR